MLLFSSDPDGEARGHQGPMDGPFDGNVLPLPDGLSPVSYIDAVSLSAGDVVAVAGSFVNGCDFPDPADISDEDFTQLCAFSDPAYTGEVAWQVWDDGVESLQIMMAGAEPDTDFEIRIDGNSLGNYRSDEGGMLWVAFSTDPQFDDELPLPETIRPVSSIDVVEILDATGATMVVGSFSEPCDVDYEYDAGATELCSTAEGYVNGTVVWMNMSTENTVVSQTIFIDLWDYEAGMTYTAEIDGIEVGTLQEMDWWGDALGLVIGDGGDVALPDGLDPVSAIDLIRILDGNGTEVSSGSFSDPCSDHEPGNDDGGNTIYNNSRSSSF